MSFGNMNPCDPHGHHAREHAEEQLRECREHLRVQTAALADDLTACRAERDTARAAHLESQENGARVKLDRDKLFNECGAWEARYVKRGHELLALQAKVARAVALLELALANWCTQQHDPNKSITQALEALR